MMIDNIYDPYQVMYVPRCIELYICNDAEVTPHLFLVRNNLPVIKILYWQYLTYRKKKKKLIEEDEIVYYTPSEENRKAEGSGDNITRVGMSYFPPYVRIRFSTIPAPKAYIPVLFRGKKVATFFYKKTNDKN